MLKITLLCNAGLALDDGEQILLVDLPNLPSHPFYGLPEKEWLNILNKVPPYDRVCGFCFTHSHPDHFCAAAVRKYLLRWPGTPVFLPEQGSRDGAFAVGSFGVRYYLFDHAPLPEGVPPHAVLRIFGGEKQVWVAGDASLDQEKHFHLIKDRMADAAFWNATYLSYAWTRTLMSNAAKRNFVYHMPVEHPDQTGLWKKCENNLRRYSDELKRVSVLGNYPAEILL